MTNTNRLDAWHLPEPDAAILIRLQAQGAGTDEIEVLHLYGHGPVDHGLPVSANNFQIVLILQLAKVDGFHLEGAFHLVHGEGTARRQGLLPSPTEVLYLGREEEGKLGQLVRHQKLVNEILPLLELRQVHLGHARDAVMVDRLNDQLGILQQVGRDRIAVQAKERADDGLGGGSLDEGLPVDVDAGVELVVLAEMVEGGQRAEVAVAQNYASTTGAIAERNPQDTVLVRSVLGSLKPDGGLRAVLVVFVDDPELVARRTHFLEHPQVALRNEGPTALPVPDELDDVDATLVQFGEIELPLGAQHGGILVLEDPLPGRGQTVQVDRGVDGLEVSAVEVEGIDLESLHQERVDVLDGELELHRFVRLEELLVVCGEIEIYPVLEGVDRNRGQHGVPLLGISDACR